MTRPNGSSGPRRSGARGIAQLGDKALDAVEHLGQPAVQRRLRGAALRPVLVTSALVGIVVGLVASVFAVAGVVYGVTAVADGLRSGAPAPRAYPPETVSMKIVTNDQFGPRYTNPDWSVHAGQVVTLRITNYDNGAAPLTGFQVAYDNVEGTLDSTKQCNPPQVPWPQERCTPVSTVSVDGRALSHVPNDQVSHTFTIPALGVNIPIPLATSTKGLTVVARFVATKTGTFVWQCYAPCGSGQSGMGGAMSVSGWMEGKVTVLA